MFRFSKIPIWKQISITLHNLKRQAIRYPQNPPLKNIHSVRTSDGGPSIKGGDVHFAVVGDRLGQLIVDGDRGACGSLGSEPGFEIVYTFCSIIIIYN